MDRSAQRFLALYSRYVTDLRIQDLRLLFHKDEQVYSALALSLSDTSSNCHIPDDVNNLGMCEGPTAVSVYG
jgi:hypothetical protein